MLVSHTNYVPFGPVPQESLLTVLAITLFFLFVYCFMLFITMSFTFQTKTVTRNRYTALERSCGRVSAPWPFRKATLLLQTTLIHFPSTVHPLKWTRQNPIAKMSQYYYIITSISIILVVLFIYNHILLVLFHLRYVKVCF